MKKTLTYIKQFLWIPERAWIMQLAIAFVTMIAMVILNVSVPLIFKKIVDVLSKPTHLPIHPLTYGLLLLYGIAWTLSQIITQIRSYVVSTLLEKVNQRVSLQLFDHLHTLSLRFHVERKTGAIASAINRASYGIEALFWGLLLFMIPTLIEIALAIGIITYLYGLYYTIPITIILIVYMAASIYGLEWSQKYHETYNEKRSATKAFMIDSLLNFETVKYFMNERYEHKLCKQALDEQTATAQKMHWSTFLLQFAQAIIIGLGLTAITAFAGISVMKNAIAISDFFLINSYILQFVIPLSYFGFILQQIRKGFVDVSDALTLLEQEPEIKDSPKAIVFEASEVSIQFNHVSFGYGHEREILKDISFTVPAGKTVALVGHTGSGKSTIAKLLFRFYDVTEGQILLNNVDIRAITQKSLHELIGIVPQDTILFNNTLYYNIAYGALHKLDVKSSQEVIIDETDLLKKEVEQAAHLAQLDQFIENLPDKYQSMVGERGLKVSGGEKQRVALARTLLKKPLIYIFDEATSALDTKTEKEIQHNIRKISEGATTVIIAHRLSTIVFADEILVFNKGEIIERGTHEQLLEKNGIYACLWHEQATKSECLV